MIWWLIVIGIIVVVASFLLGEKLSPEQTQAKEQTMEQLKKAMEESVANFRNEARDLSENVQEETERALEKICNEKIMAIQEDSNSVFEDIEKNHQEVVFLYGMLEDKKKEIEDFTNSLRQETKDTREMVQDMMLARDIAQMMEQEIVMGRKVVEDIQRTTEECQAVLQDVVDAIAEAADEAQTQSIQRVMEAAEEAQTQGLERVRSVEEAAEKATEKVTERAAQFATEAKELESRIEASLLKGSQVEQMVKAVKESKDRQEPKAQESANKPTKTVKNVVEKDADEIESAENIMELKEIIDKDEISHRPVRRTLRNTAARKPAESKNEKVLESVAKSLSRVQKASEKKDLEERSASPAEKGNFNQRILQMYKDGMSETEIAKQLSMGVGEVKLVIGLFEGARR